MFLDLPFLMLCSSVYRCACFIELISSNQHFTSQALNSLIISFSVEVFNPIKLGLGYWLYIIWNDN